MPSPAETLAALLRVPPGARDPANAAGRREVLRALLAGPTEPTLAQALVDAGLDDPDGRVRMIAVLAVGRLKLAALARKAMAAPVPAAGTQGFGQEDRRALLALRHAAHDVALGLPPGTGIAGGPGSLPGRIAHQSGLHALLAGGRGSGDPRADALVADLLGQ